eukprot:s707_g15.t1
MQIPRPLRPFNADPPALGAKIVPKPSSVAVTVPARASTEDIDKWDDLEEESVEAGGSLSSLTAATAAVVEAETHVPALTQEAEPKLPSVASFGCSQSGEASQPTSATTQGRKRNSCRGGDKNARCGCS